MAADPDNRSPVIMRDGSRFRAVRPNPDGSYEDSVLLPKSSPWHAISKLVLKRGGHFVEMVEDEEFAETLLRRGEYRPTTDVAWFDAGEPLACVKNASEAAQRIPSATIHIGLGLHYADGAGGGIYWCRHTYLTVPRLGARGGRAIYEVTVGPWGYYGFLATPSDWRFWVHYAGGTLADEQMGR